MTSCNHETWFDIAGDDDFYLRDWGRLQRLVKDIASPEAVYPSLTVFLGKQTMQLALRQIFPHNKPRPNRRQGLVNLYADSSTTFSDTPHFWATANPSHGHTKSQTDGEDICHKITTHAIHWDPPLGTSASTVLLARLSFLFCDVICIFADDCGGLEGVADLLKLWTSIGSASTLPYAVRPRVIVAVTEEDASATYEFLQHEELRHRLNEQDTSLQSQTFSLIKVVRLAGSQLSPLARYRRLKEVIFNECDQARTIRKHYGALFSATHLCRFFELAAAKIARSHSPVNLITMAREANPVSSYFGNHCHEFLSISGKMKIAPLTIFDHLASSIAMNAFPPGMHRFHPGAVFDELYLNHVTKALQWHGLDGRTVETWTRHIRRRMNDMTYRSHHTMASRHWASMVALSSVLGSCRSNRTCLFCLCRPPEHSISCGHSICDFCVRRFGTGMAGYESRFCLACPLCETSGQLVAHLCPPTAGVRILSIDGGGVGGVVPLEIMKTMQGYLGSSVSLQDMFDLAVGTSSGGLTVIGLFLRKWTTEECADTFDSLSRQLFKSRSYASYRILSRFKGVLECILHDGHYDINLFETLLKDAFGSTSRIFGPGITAVSGTRVAVTAANISNAYTYLFSNYNGVERRSEDCDYKHIRANDPSTEPFLWEAGRATSAAPVFFASASIASLGSFQDGGLRHNNPANLALCEAKHVWSSRIAPDILLSLGTGAGEDTRSPKLSHFRNFISDGFISRLTRLFMGSFNREGPWRDLINQVDDDRKKDYIRLNIPLSPGKIVRLDDVSRMDELKASVHRQPDNELTCEETSWSLLLSSFYLHLETKPEYRNGFYACYAQLRCRLAGEAVFEAMGRFTQVARLISSTESYGPLDRVDICPQCQRYRKRILLNLRSLTEQVPLWIRYGSEQRAISAGRTALDWYIDQQGLDSVFGTEDHGTPHRLDCIRCGQGIEHKRKYPSHGLHPRKRQRRV